MLSIFFHCFQPNTESKEGEPEAGGSQDSGYDEELVGTYKVSS